MFRFAEVVSGFCAMILLLAMVLLLTGCSWTDQFTPDAYRTWPDDPILYSEDGTCLALVGTTETGHRIYERGVCEEKPEEGE